MSKIYRSILFTPGNRWNMIEKASTLNPDAITLDLEDSVPIPQKEEARELVLRALTQVNWLDKDVGVRINSLDTRYWAVDLYEVVKGNPDFIMLPKASKTTDIILVDKLLNSLENQYKLDTKIKLLVTIENAEGLKNIYDIVKASDRIMGITFGKADFTADVGCEDKEEILFIPKLLVVFAAAIANIQAIDTGFLNIKDLEGLKKEATRSKLMGYTGKFAIHPAQIDVINNIFTPSEKEIEYSKKIIAAYEESVRKGIGAVALEGKMIDEAIVKRAKRILKLAGEL